MINKSENISKYNKDYYNSWLETTYGREFFQAELNLLSNKLFNIFGFHILQVGSERLDYFSNLEEKLKIKHRIILTNNYNYSAHHNNNNNNSVLFGSSNYIPLESESMDAVLIAHGLEFNQDPHGLLREVDRVLMPEGHVIILGFNPLSLWGLRKSLTFKSSRETIFPWDGTWLSSYRVCDWLNLLNYKLDLREHFFYRPCINNEKVFRYTKFFDKVGKMIPVGSAGYCIIAVKRQAAYVPIDLNMANSAWRKSVVVGSESYIKPTSTISSMKTKNGK